METTSPASKIKANLQELFQANLAPGDAYIRFQLTSDTTTLLSMEQVQESLIVEADKITPLPDLPEAVVGIVSSRDRVFCVFDLAQLLGQSSPFISPRQYHIIVLQTIGDLPIYIGLAVSRLQGIVRLATEQIQLSKEAFSAEIAPYISGSVQENETIIPILEFDSISRAIHTIKQDQMTGD